jgi:hypothetical protein
MKSLIAVLALLLTSIATSPRSGIGMRIAAPTSIFQLIATPDKYDQKSLSAVGYLEIQTGSSVLYLHREDHDFGLYPNSLKVEFEEKLTDQDEARFNLKYVYLLGTFDAKDKGPHSEMGGSIKHSAVVMLWPGRRPQPSK